MTARRSRYYILNGRYIEPCGMVDWAKWFGASKDRFLAQEHVGPFFVSTVFLGLDHNYGNGPPILFESAIFLDGSVKWGDREIPGLDDVEMRRSCTWDQAMHDHKELLAIAAEKVAAADRLLLSCALPK